MKTAISLPDATFERATRKSKELGISRSEFFARAAEVYLDELSSHSLTREINEALETAGTDESTSAAVTAGRRRLTEDDW
jgi:predicted DNA-binding protein